MQLHTVNAQNNSVREMKLTPEIKKNHLNEINRLLFYS